MKRKSPLKIEPPADAELVSKLKKRYYSHFDMGEFRKRVANFWELDLADAASDAAKAVGDVLRFQEQYVFPFSWDEYQPNFDIWRVREMDAEYLKEGVRVSDLWEAPARHAKSGRFNETNESLLYACMASPGGTMAEARLAPGSSFILIQYEFREPLVLKRVGQCNPDSSLTRRERRVEREVSRFVRDVVSVSAGQFGPDTYTFTRQVLREFLPLEGGWEVGWRYESTLVTGLQNVALEPETAHARLTVRSVIVGRVEWVDEKGASARYLGFSDGIEMFGDKIGFQDFPNCPFETIQQLVEWVEANRVQFNSQHVSDDVGD